MVEPPLYRPAAWLTGRPLVAAIAAAVAVYLAMLTLTLPELTRLSGGLAMFDLRPAGYDAAQAHAILKALGVEGRHFYLTRQLALDAVYPALLGLSLAGLWLRLSGAAGLASPRWALLTLLPAAALLDYGENLGIAAMLLAYPDESEGLVVAASVFTIGKTAVSTICFLGVVTVAILAASRRRRAP